MFTHNVMSVDVNVGVCAVYVRAFRPNSCFSNAMSLISHFDLLYYVLCDAI